MGVSQVLSYLFMGDPMTRVVHMCKLVSRIIRARKDWLHPLMLHCFMRFKPVVWVAHNINIISIIPEKMYVAHRHVFILLKLCPNYQMLPDQDIKIHVLCKNFHYDDISIFHWFFNSYSLKMNYVLALFTTALSLASICKCSGDNEFRAKRIERVMNIFFFKWHLSIGEEKWHKGSSSCMIKYNFFPSKPYLISGCEKLRYISL